MMSLSFWTKSYVAKTYIGQLLGNFWGSTLNYAFSIRRNKYTTVIEFIIFLWGELVYGAAKNGKQIIPEQKDKAQKLPLDISCEGQLAALLAFWLSHFVLLFSKAIRPECFYMASLMAQG